MPAINICHQSQIGLQMAMAPAAPSERDAPISQTLVELRHLVDELALTDDVLNALLPRGRPHDFESELWDFKERLSVLPDRPTDDEKKVHKGEIGELLKDALAFHNAYGGYIVFGVTDKGRHRLVGCEADFDCGDFNKRLHAFTS